MDAPIQEDYYAILEVRQEADIDKIKKAFRRLAPLCHLDKNPQDPNACIRFISVRFTSSLNLPAKLAGTYILYSCVKLMIR